MTAPGDDLRPTERFSPRAENYRRNRPGYPAAVAALVKAGCGHSQLHVGDIGAGTGIFSRLLLEAGLDVTALEPNDAMRAVAVEDLAGFPGFRAVKATAEESGLADVSLAAITVAQAFHWFEPVATRREFARLLEPGGQAHLIWNDRVSQPGTFGRAYDDVLLNLGEAYAAVARRHGEAVAARVRDFFAPTAAQHTQFPNPQVLDWMGLRGRFLSASYVPLPGEPSHDRALGELESAFAAHEQNGLVTLDQVTIVFSGPLL